VRVVDHGETCDGTPFVAMRRLTGVPLGSLIQREGPLALDRIRSIAAQLCNGLEAIHGQGFVHADLKSDNLLLDVAAGDHISIIDFGLARAPHTRLRNDQRIISGTPEYMAPEIIRGEAITTAADIYAAGIILYELVTGSTPFDGGSTNEVFTRHLEDDVVPPSMRCPDRTIPRSLDAAIVHALAKDPRVRPYTIRELRDAVLAAIPVTEATTQMAAHVPVYTTMAPTRRWTRSAVALGHAKTIVHACLDRARHLISEGKPDDAAAEMQRTAAALREEPRTAGAAWRLLLTLGALQGGRGELGAAWEAILDARRIADEVHDPVGRRRANALLERFDARRDLRRVG
ncbi:MAG TPA: serine/threonine-protein kinase, partial [Kofleriaceae bacterium]|nr:serine/threonine-protein kinase [Kofleriaceae bacterium]